MKHALTNVFFIVVGFLLCGAVEGFANVVASKGLKRDSHNELKGA